MNVAKRVAGQPRYVAKRVTDEVANPPGPGGGGGISSADDLLQLITTNDPPDAFALWQTSSLTTVENRTIQVAVRTSIPVKTNSQIPIVLDAASTVDADDVVVPSEAVVLENSNETLINITFTSTAAQASSRTCVLKLDPDAATGSNFPTLPTNTDFGPDTLTITVNDEVIVGGPAEWTLQPKPEVPEGAGLQSYQIFLDKPTTTDSDVVIDVAVSGGSASSVIDYNFTSPTRVTIPNGEIEASFQIDFPNNEVEVPPGFDPTLQLTASYVSGNVGNTASQTITTTILDNDQGASTTPIIQFVASQVEGLAGRSYAVTAYSVNANNEPQNPGTFAPYPVEVTESAGMTGRYTVEWARPDYPDTIAMEPDQNRTTFTVTFEDPVAEGETLSFRILTALEAGQPGGTWLVGSRNTCTLTIAAQETTELIYPSFSGVTASRSRVVQGLYAIDPPAATVPEMAFAANGIKAQCFGHKRNADGNWIAGYFYGIAQTDSESVPDSSPVVEELRLAKDSDAVLAKTSIGAAETLTFSLKAANQALLYEADITTMSGLDKGNWSSSDSGATWTSVGDASYIEENVTRIPLVRSDIAAKGDGDHYLAAEALGYIELCETQYVGDDIRIFHGRFVNGNWSQGKDPVALNPQVNGEIYIESLDLSVPGGSTYSITLGNAHPSQSLDVGLKSAELLVDRAQDYFFPACASYPFSFAIYPTGDTDAQARAESYLDMRHIAWAAGAYGPTRNAIYGEGAEPTIDYRRMGLTRQGRQGWSAIKYIGDIQGDGGGPQSSEGYKNAWANGTGVAGSEHARIGWFQSTGPSKASNQGASGSEGIYGASGLVPWWGYWLRQKYVLYATASRYNITYRDTNTWEPGWWWNLATQVGVPAQMVVPFVGNPVNRRGTIRHYHFNTPNNTTQFDLWGATNYADFQLAPTTQLYNTADVAPPSPTIDGETQTEEYFIRDKWGMEAATHMARASSGAVDMWDGCRMQMAYAFREEMATFCSRLLSPARGVTNGPTADEENYYAMGVRYQRLLDLAAAASGRGVWPRTGGDNPDLASDGQPRGWSWPMIWLGGFYAIASDATRAQLRGQNINAPTTEYDLVNVQQNLWRLVPTPHGIPSFSTGDDFTPDPNDDATFGETDIPTRRNAWPNNDNDALGVYGEPNTLVQAVGVPFFQMPVWSRAIRIWKQFAINTSQMDRALKWHDNIVVAHRAFSPDGGEVNLPYCAVVAIGDKHLGRVDEVPDMVSYTLDDVRSGKFRWLWSPTTQGGDDGGSLLRKVGWSSYDAAVGLSDDTYLNLFQDSWGSVSDLSEADFAQLLATEVNDTIFNASNNTSYKLFGEWTFYAAYLAYLLNRVS